MSRIYFIFGLLAGIILLMSFSANPPNGYTNAPGEGLCTACHTNPGAQQGTITLTGFPVTIDPSTAYVLTITNTVTSGTAQLAGFQMTILNGSNQQAGTMSSPSPTSTLQSSGGRQYWEHNPAQPYSGNSVSWTVTWTSPSMPAGTTISYYAAGNVASGSNGNQNDRIVTSTGSGTLQSSGMPLMVDIVASTNVTCFDGADGSATAAGTGGTEPYTYTWSNGASGATANNLASGTYTVTVTDDDAFTATNSVTITEPDPIIITAQVTGISCPGANDGGISALASGGVPPYQYDWSNGASGASITGLGPGTYILTVTDDNGCTETSSFNVTEPAALQINLVELSNETCAGDNDGFIQISVSGGTSPYFAEWSNGFIGNSISDLAPDVYGVTVTDNNNCTATASYIIEAGGMVDVMLDNITHVSCNGGSDGSLSVEAFGGQSPYTYEWSNGATGPVITGLAAGNYLLTATDDNGCDVVKVYMINQPAPIVISILPSGENLCDGDSLVTLTAMVTGDNPPFTAQWSNGVPGLVNPNVPAGNYILSVTDANNCTATQEIVVAGPPALTLSVSTTHETASGTNDGTATATVGGGTPGYTYLWGNGQTTAMISGLAPGTYSVTASDANGCEIEGMGVVNAFGCTLGVTIEGDQIVCEGDSALLDAIAGGATGSVTYLWSNGDTTQQILAGAGTHCVTVTDEAGCVAEACVNVETIPVPVFLCPVIHESAPGANDGAIQCDSIPGVVSYAWSNGATTPGIDSLAPGEYCLTVTDMNGCVYDQCFTIQPGNCQLLITSILAPPVCNGDTTGGISVSVENATPPVTFLWSNGDTTSTISNITAGSYTATITDGAGCVAVESFELSEPDVIVITVDSVGAVGATGDGYIFITVTGGIMPYSYVWITPDQSQLLTEDITGLTQSGFYSLMVLDGVGCEVALDSVFVDMDVAVRPGPEFKPLRVYPVPADDMVVIDLDQPLLEVWISGADGRTYQKINAPAANRLDISGLDAGWYILRMWDGQQWYIARIVK